MMGFFPTGIELNEGSSGQFKMGLMNGKIFLHRFGSVSGFTGGFLTYGMFIMSPVVTSSNLTNIQVYFGVIFSK